MATFATERLSPNRIHDNHAFSREAFAKTRTNSGRWRRIRQITIELARRGYDVVLLDLVPEMLKLAKNKAKRTGAALKVKQFVQGSIEDLSIFPDNTFDAVLCLGGPLSHLLKAEQRKNAAKELARVAKNGAPIFVSVISRIGLLRTLLIRFQHEMQYAKHHWEVGNYILGQQGEDFMRRIGSYQRNCRCFLKNKGGKSWKWPV